MRILQLIDSLEPGGSERMAVNYANALVNEIECSAIAVTRFEGELKKQLNPEVKYIYLNRKSTLDTKAFLKLKAFIKSNRIEIIHAHSSSFFIACMVKLILPSIKIVWHDHYGNSEYLDRRSETKILKYFSFMFTSIISVNMTLKQWAQNNLNCNKVIYLPNFALKQNNTDKIKNTFLKGVQGKRIVCLANLRPQKNHFFLLEIAKKLKQIHPDWSFHLVGKNFEDQYAKDIVLKIKEYSIEDTVYLYGSCNDIEHILSQADIGILTSISEGLPVSLLEYGLNKLPVISTNVGEISKVIENNELGILVEKSDIEKFYNSLINLITNPNERMKLAANFHLYSIENYSEKNIVLKYLQYIN